MLGGISFKVLQPAETCVPGGYIDGVFVPATITISGPLTTGRGAAFQAGDVGTLVYTQGLPGATSATVTVTRGATAIVPPTQLLPGQFNTIVVPMTSV
jgi:hypothetical protein